jgi:hypothetical protein
LTLRKVCVHAGDHKQETDLPSLNNIAQAVQALVARCIGNQKPALMLAANEPCLATSGACVRNPAIGAKACQH